MTLKWPHFVILILILFLGIYFNYYIYFANLKSSIFGDQGDSFFNLWLLENVRLFFTNFDLTRFINTNIFYPDNKLVLFWSDNLIFPGILYSGLIFFVKDKIFAYNLLTYFTFVASFFSVFLFFKIILQNTINKSSNIVHFFIALLFTYNYTFSAVRMQYAFHFQNQWAFLCITGCSGLLLIETQKKAGVIIACLSYLLLCYSAIYHAVIFASICLFYILFICYYNGTFYLITLIKNYWFYALTSLFLSFPILLGYFLCKKQNFSQDFYSSIFSDFFLPSRSPEPLIYIGKCIFIIAVALFIYYFFQFILNIKSFSKNHVLQNKIAYLLLLFLILFYGISFGYSKFNFYQFNISIYQFLSAIIPGMNSMRAIGRAGALGNCILYGIIFYFLASNLHLKSRRIFIVLILVLMSLNLIEQKTAPYVQSPNISVLQATAEEDNYFKSKLGNFVVFPISPDQLNVYSMIYFLPYTNIFLLNGYSAHIPEFYSIVVNHSQRLKFSEKLMNLLKSKNVQYAVFQKWRYSKNQLNFIQKKFQDPEFNNNRFIVAKLK